MKTESLCGVCKTSVANKSFNLHVMRHIDSKNITFVGSAYLSGRHQSLTWIYEYLGEVQVHACSKCVRSYLLSKKTKPDRYLIQNGVFSFILILATIGAHVRSLHVEKGNNSYIWEGYAGLFGVAAFLISVIFLLRFYGDIFAPWMEMILGMCPSFLLDKAYIAAADATNIKISIEDLKQDKNIHLKSNTTKNFFMKRNSNGHYEEKMS